MKMLITGSSGLLGADIYFESLKQGHSVVGICRNPLKEYEMSVDITSPQGAEIVSSVDFDIIIHTAAWRNPDECERNRDGTYKINVTATDTLAKIARRKGAKFLHISTDYVFSGENPPYSEKSSPSPVNYYGETKYLAEKTVSKILPEACILRIPLLYGIRAGLTKSAVILTALKALDSTTPWGMEDSIVRYPTFTGDVAKAVLFLINNNTSGIFHFSGENKTTRYLMTLEMAKIFGKKNDNIVRLPEPPAAEAVRPHNSQLSMENIISLGFPHPLPFHKRIISMKDEILKQYEGAQ